MLNNMMSFRKYASSRRCSAERLIDNRKILVGTPATGHNSAFFSVKFGAFLLRRNFRLHGDCKEQWNMIKRNIEFCSITEVFMSEKPIRIAVTGAAGQIAYSLLFRIAAGDIFGENRPVILNLLEIEPALTRCNGVVMELEDCAFPLLKEVTATTDPKVAFQDADWCLLLGSAPRKAGMERRDLLDINGKIFVDQGKAIAAHASKDVKVLVVGNPCNINALIALRHAEGVPVGNFFAMTGLDESRSKYQLAQKAGVHVSAVKNMTIWGNHSSTQFPDFTNATIRGIPVPEVIRDKTWLEETFVPAIQKRGAAIIETRGVSSAASAANAIVETVRKLINPTPTGDWFSVSVLSNGEYGTEPGLITGFPLRTDANGNHEIVPNLEINDYARAQIDASIEELKEERKLASEVLSCRL